MEKQIPVVRGIERLKGEAAIRSVDGSGMAKEVQSPPRQLDLDAIERLMEFAERRGYAYGVDEQDRFARQREHGAREMAIDQTAAVFIDVMARFLSDLQAVFAEPVAVENAERPPDEWVDDRAERLQALTDEFRGTIQAAAVATGNSLPVTLEEMTLKLWTLVQDADTAAVEDEPVMPNG